MYTVLCQTDDGRQFAELIEAKSPESARQIATGRGYHPVGVPMVFTGSAPSGGATYRPAFGAPPPGKLGSAAIVVARIGFLFPILALVAIVMGAIAGDKNGRSAIGTSILVLILWAVIFAVLH